MVAIVEVALLLASGDALPGRLAAVKISVVSLGCVGLPNAVVLAQPHQAVDAERVDQVTARQLPLVDAELEDFLAARELSVLNGAPDKVYTCDLSDRD